MKNYMNNFFKSWSGKLVGINVVIFSVMFFYNYFQEKTWDLSIDTLGKFGALHPHQSAWFSVVTMMFLHGGLAHIFCNSVSLRSIGTTLEQHAKNWFLPVYFISGVASGIAVYFYGSDWTVGASGAICGIWAMLIVYNMKYTRNRAMIVFTMIDLALLIYMSSLPKVSAIGHFSGFMTGLVLGFIYFTWYYVEEKNADEVEIDNLVEEEKSEKRLIITESEYNQLLEKEKLISK